MPGWSSKLARPLVLKSGPVLLTLSDVRALCSTTFPRAPAAIPGRLTAELLLTAAKDPGEIEARSGALFLRANWMLPAD